MTLAAACGWSLVRSLAIALVAWPVCRAETNWLRHQSHRRRRLAWWVLVIPFLCPELWAGYAWSGFAVRLAGTGVWEFLPSGLFPTPQSVVWRDAAVDEILFDVLLFCRAVPVGTLALYFAPPPPLSPEAVYCWKLSVGQAVPDAIRVQSELAATEPSDLAMTERYPLTPGPSPARGEGSKGSGVASGRFMGRNPLGWMSASRVRLESLTYRALPALALMFLVAFQEFELASLIGRPAWTVWLFDAQVGGLALSESLRKMILPVLCQSAVLLPLAWLILSSRAQRESRRRWRRLSRWEKLVPWCAAAAGLVALLAVPAWLVGQGTFSGLLRLARTTTQARMLVQEIFVGLGYSLSAAVLSALIAAGLMHAARRQRRLTATICAAALPGLVGSLVLGLVLIRIFQLPALQFAYKSPLSLASGLVLFLLPRALLVRFLFWSSARPAAEYLSRLLAASPFGAVRAAAGDLSWQLRWRGEFWGVALLAYWGFFDLTTASLLAPVTIVSPPVMLYNQMHFGKNATLSALVLLTVIIPLAVFAALAVSRRLIFRWFWR